MFSRMPEPWGMASVGISTYIYVNMSPTDSTYTVSESQFATNSFWPLLLNLMYD